MNCKLFDNVDIAESVSVQCEKKGKLLNCSATCKDPNAALSGASTLKCKGKKFFPKAGALSCLSKSRVTKCGPVDAKFSFAENVDPNCDGVKTCKPSCPDGEVASISTITCFKAKKKQHKPAKGTVTCSAPAEEAPRPLDGSTTPQSLNTVLGKCGNLMSPKNKRIVNRIDSSVQMSCTPKNCKLSCVNSLHSFDADSAKWETQPIICRKKKVVPKVVEASCSLGAKQAAGNLLAPLGESSRTELEGPTCKTDFFDMYNAKAEELTVKCSGNICQAKCKNTGLAANFTWPDGSVVQKLVYKCDRGRSWKPSGGTISC